MTYHLCAVLAVSTVAVFAQSPTATLAAPEWSWSWLQRFQDLPVLRTLWGEVKAPEQSRPAAASAPLGCAVQPLAPIQDPQALAFEAGSAALVNVSGLTPGTAHALVRFEHLVISAGGVLRVTSAWRPAAYQQHLQAVWDKWMLQLRTNSDARCQALKAEVQQEFTRHQLLETQRPVSSSDHTRGVGFDAAVLLPMHARRRRHRLTPDALARLAKLRRPDVLHDPVHFRFIAAHA